MYKRTILTICLLFLGIGTLQSQETNRGIALAIKDKDGQEVGLYRESHALIIGVSDYTNGWDPLPGVLKDVEAVGKALEENGFEVDTVLDPDSNQLEAAFENFIRDHGRKKENRLLFWFAGHGHTLAPPFSPDERMGYLVPKDAPLPDGDENEAEFDRLALPMQRIEEYAERRIYARHALFLFDSCFSGALLETTRSTPIPENISYKTAKPVRQFITAGEAGEVVPDHSIFREQFIEALAGAGDADSDGFLTGVELGEFLQKHVIHYSKKKQHPQYAKSRNSRLDDGDFVFAVGRNVPDKIFEDFEIFQDRLKDGSLGPRMIVVPAGKFTMGSPKDEPERDDNREGPQHQVHIAKRFAMGVTEVTFEDYDRFASATDRRFPNDQGWGYGKRPVINVSWNEASAYARWLTKQTGKQYRLPSEAEWEYAARAGTTTPFSTGDCIHTDQANYDGDGEDYTDCGAKTGVYRKQTVPAGSLTANPWGFFDMYGNVWEWIEDCWHENYQGAPTDGTVWREKNNGDCFERVIRGSGWIDAPKNLRSAYRKTFATEVAAYDVGFRLARDIPNPLVVAPAVEEKVQFTSLNDHAVGVPTPRIMKERLLFHSKESERITTSSEHLKGKAQITSLKGNERVTTPEHLKGECENVPEGTYLWILARPKFAQNYHPQSNQPDSGPISNGCDGTWEGITHLGASVRGDINRKFEILLVGTDIKGSDIMQNYLKKASRTNRWVGIGQLPEGTTIYQKLTVIRR
uniref:Formylglycine-generating enzyme, required for sulfatase activity, contains SUMF1/FGE domain n=1 Tax=Candidatus Kentrum sp. FW TaxID=2126338 RepID=A0A450T832_9GAMM|nr:MAG: Formylglycine-generating enzyme, required for sulfatase activity, contains SUMF1/FGE domain [Candidatus Kentron sp. FW]